MSGVLRRAVTSAKAVKTHVEIEIENIEIPTKIKEKKNKRYEIRFSERELKNLKDYCDAEDINISDIIRNLLTEKGII